MSAAAEAALGTKPGLGIEMVMEGTDPLVSLLFTKEDSVGPRFRKQKQNKSKQGVIYALFKFHKTHPFLSLESCSS